MLRSSGHNVIKQGRTQHSDFTTDFSDVSLIDKFFERTSPDVVVNLVAATNVDQCESEPKLAWKTNVDIVSIITNSIKKYNGTRKNKIHLIHLSTDQVYSGTGPHDESCILPVNVYGMSKHAGELLAGDVNATIIRTNFYGRSYCANRFSFSDWLVDSIRSNSVITVFDDIIFSGVHINTLCYFIILCIVQRPSGTFNIGCRDSISKARFALSLARMLNLPTEQVRIGALSDITLKALRPNDMSLVITRFEDALGVKCPTIQDELKHTAREYLNA